MVRSPAYPVVERTAQRSTRRAADAPQRHPRLPPVRSAGRKTSRRLQDRPGAPPHRHRRPENTRKTTISTDTTDGIDNAREAGNTPSRANHCTTAMVRAGCHAAICTRVCERGVRACRLHRLARRLPLLGRGTGALRPLAPWSPRTVAVPSSWLIIRRRGLAQGFCDCAHRWRKRYCTLGCV